MVTSSSAGAADRDVDPGERADAHPKAVGQQDATVPVGESPEPAGDQPGDALGVELPGEFPADPDGGQVSPAPDGQLTATGLGSAVARQVWREQPAVREPTLIPVVDPDARQPERERVATQELRWASTAA